MFAVCIIIIAAIWFFVNKLDEQDEIITIKLKTETINLDQGADFNLDQYIDQVTDKNGNELIWSETKNIQGTYWISEQPNTDIPGNYELSVFALTKENQLADKKITVIVNGQKQTMRMEQQVRMKIITVAMTVRLIRITVNHTM